MNAADVIGYTYEADEHCESCAIERFGAALYDETAEDAEGNPPHPIFGDHEPSNAWIGCYCGTCGDEIVEGAWSGASTRERIRACADAGVSIFAARRDRVPSGL